MALVSHSLPSQQNGEGIDAKVGGISLIAKPPACVARTLLPSRLPVASPHCPPLSAAGSALMSGMMLTPATLAPRW